jgi:hypothetical protein
MTDAQIEFLLKRLDKLEEALAKLGADVHDLTTALAVSKGGDKAAAETLRGLVDLPARVAVLENARQMDEVNAARQQAWTEAWIGEKGFLRSTQFIVLVLVTGAALGLWSLQELSATYNAISPTTPLEEKLPLPPEPAMMWGREPAKD